MTIWISCDYFYTLKCYNFFQFLKLPKNWFLSILFFFRFLCKLWVFFVKILVWSRLDQISRNPSGSRDFLTSDFWLNGVNRSEMEEDQNSVWSSVAKLKNKSRRNLNLFSKKIFRYVFAAFSHEKFWISEYPSVVLVSWWYDIMLQTLNNIYSKILCCSVNPGKFLVWCLF